MLVKLSQKIVKKSKNHRSISKIEENQHENLTLNLILINFSANHCKWHKWNELQRKATGPDGIPKIIKTTRTLINYHLTNINKDFDQYWLN